MKCQICDKVGLELGKDGISYRFKFLCDNCLLNLLFVTLDKHKDGIKRYLTKELSLAAHSE